MKSAPAIPLFGDAYLADTRHLTLEEHGAYLQLLMIAWRSPGCALPDDDKRLAMMLGITTKKWAGLKPTVMAFWALNGDGWQQKRLLKERRFVAEKSEQNRAAINARWEANRLKNKDADDTNVIPEPYGNDTPPPSLEEEGKKKEEVGGADAPSGKYAFEGDTIRLNHRHFNLWAKALHTIQDLAAELLSLDAWWQAQPADKRKTWFHPTLGMLNRKHQENLAAVETYDRDRITV